MAMPSIRWFRRIAIAPAFVAPIGALLWAVWWLWSRLMPQWHAIVIVAMALLAAIWWLWWRLPGRSGGAVLPTTLTSLAL
jgi:hypothetical protein